VSTPMTTSTSSASIVLRSPCRDGRVVPVRVGDRQDCDGTRQQKPGGQAPDQASHFHRAGAGNRERTSPGKARGQSEVESHPGSPAQQPSTEAGMPLRSSQSDVTPARGSPRSTSWSVRSGPAPHPRSSTGAVGRRSAWVTAMQCFMAACPNADSSGCSIGPEARLRHRHRESSHGRRPPSSGAQAADRPSRS